ncbi:MAG: hypothetical protein RIB84_11660 [Sneathiellaceae bacterium]
MAKSRTTRARPKDRGQKARAAATRTATPRPLAQPRTLRRLWGVLAGALLLVVLANFAITPKGHFGIDGSFAFFAWFGFLSCLALVILGKVIGVFVRRDESYYATGLDLGDDDAAPGVPAPDPDAADDGAGRAP